MNVLDENILEGEREILRKWRIRAKKIGHDIGRKGMKDENQVIPLLHSLRQPVLFTRDLGPYRVELVHKAYCIACIAARPNETAAFVRRFLRHSAFDTKAKRMGSVVHMSDVGLRAWRLSANEETILTWDER